MTAVMPIVSNCTDIIYQQDTTHPHMRDIPNVVFKNAAGIKINRAFMIILAIFLWVDWHFLSSHACYKQYNA